MLGGKMGCGGGSEGSATGGPMPTGGVGGLGNLGAPDSEYLNPILDQRIDFLNRMIVKLKPKKPVKKVAAKIAPDPAAAEEVEQETTE